MKFWFFEMTNQGTTGGRSVQRDPGEQEKITINRREQREQQRFVEETERLRVRDGKAQVGGLEGKPFGNENGRGKIPKRCLDG